MLPKFHIARSTETVDKGNKAVSVATRTHSFPSAEIGIVSSIVNRINRDDCSISPDSPRVILILLLILEIYFCKSTDFPFSSYPILSRAIARPHRTAWPAASENLHQRLIMPRSSHAQALLGPDLYQRVRETPVLVVGAGGIGCELCELFRAFPLPPSTSTTSETSVYACMSSPTAADAIPSVKNLVLVGFANIEMVSPLMRPQAMLRFATISVITRLTLITRLTSTPLTCPILIANFSFANPIFRNRKLWWQQPVLGTSTLPPVSRFMRDMGM